MGKKNFKSGALDQQTGITTVKRLNHPQLKDKTIQLKLKKIFPL